MPGPFDGVTPVSNDELTAVLKSFNTQNSPFLPMENPAKENTTAKQVEGGTKAGVARVNANTQQTGVEGYLDANGRAVFTQVKDSSTGENIVPGYGEKPKQVPALFKPFGTAGAADRENVLRKPDISSGIQNALVQITRAKSYEEAAGVFTVFKETIAQERARLEQEAFSLAESKLGIPALMQTLEQTRAADRASIGWYPGIGDSPVTQKVMAQIAQARGMVDNEAKNYLVQNSTYKSLANYEEQGKMHLKSVDTILQRKDRLVEETELWKVRTEFGNKQRDADRQERQKEELLNFHEGLSAKQVARINMLAAEDLRGFDATDPDSAQAKKIKEAAIARGRSKDKNFVNAINAETSQQLLSLAAQGNGQAKQLLLQEEANAMGKPIAEVEMELREFDKLLRSQDLVRKTLLLRGDKDVNKKAADFNASLMASVGKPEAIAKVNEERIGYALEHKQYEKTKLFREDVRTWGSIDQLLRDAIDRAVKNAGRADVDTVLGAYLETSKTREERVARLKDFANIMRVNAQKQSQSAFGMPNYREIEVKLNQKIGLELNPGLSFSEAAFNPVVGWVAGGQQFFQGLASTQEAVPSKWKLQQ